MSEEVEVKEGEEEEVEAKKYLQSPKPSVRLACGNCGSTKIFKRTDLASSYELEIGECEKCSKLFAVCPLCHIPSGLDTREMEDSRRFWKCPNCDVNFTLNSTNPNQYKEMWKTSPKANNYPLGNPEVTYNTKGGVSMDSLTDTLNMVPVGQLTQENEPDMEQETPVKRTRTRKPKATDSVKE